MDLNKKIGRKADFFNVERAWMPDKNIMSAMNGRPTFESSLWVIFYDLIKNSDFLPSRSASCGKK